jgi:hypothetical protein
MAIFQTQTTSFKQELLEGVHDFLVDTFNIALYTENANLGADVTVYTSAEEVSGAGYLAGGQALTGVTVASSGGIAYVNFANVVWTPANFTAAGALIYNVSKANKSVAVLSFGANKVATNSFTIQMPPNTSNAALLRFA